MLKNNYKTNLVLNITNLELPRIVTIFVYNFIYISFVVTFMVTVQIPFLVGLVLLTLEFIAFLAVLLINLKAKKMQYYEHNIVHESLEMRHPYLQDPMSSEVDPMQITIAIFDLAQVSFVNHRHTSSVSAR